MRYYIVIIVGIVEKKR